MSLTEDEATALRQLLKDHKPKPEPVMHIYKYKNMEARIDKELTLEELEEWHRRIDKT